MDNKKEGMNPPGPLPSRIKDLKWLAHPGHRDIFLAKTYLFGHFHVCLLQRICTFHIAANSSPVASIATNLIASFEHQDFPAPGEKDGDHILELSLFYLLCIRQRLYLNENLTVDAKGKGDYYLSTQRLLMQSLN
jgi:hypothetical protein